MNAQTQAACEGEVSAEAAAKAAAASASPAPFYDDSMYTFSVTASATQTEVDSDSDWQYAHKHSADPAAIQAALTRKYDPPPTTTGCSWLPFSGDTCLGEGVLTVAGGVVDLGEQGLKKAKDFTTQNLIAGYEAMEEWGPPDINKAVSDYTAGMSRGAKYLGILRFGIQALGVGQKLVNEGPMAAFKEALIDGASDTVALGVGAGCEVLTGLESFGTSTLACIGASVGAGMGTDAGLHKILDPPKPVGGGF